MLSDYTRTAKWSIFLLYIVLILVIPYKVVQLYSDDLRARNFGAHYVIRASVLKDGASICYCAYVLRILGYSGFLRNLPPNITIFLRGL